MEENNQEKTQAKKKTNTTKNKKEVNSRISDVLQKLEVEAEQKTKQTAQRKGNTVKKEETTKKTSKKSTSQKINKEEKPTEKKSSKDTKVVKNKTKSSSQKNKVTSNKKVNKKIEPSDNEKIQKIEQEINNQKKFPKEIKEKVNKTIFTNFLMGIVINIYLIFINLGYMNINETAFITDLQVFSITLIITTIIIFEQAYKKDSGKLTIYGIEVLALSIITMVLPRIYNEYKELFVDIVGIVSIVYIMYYIIKSTIIYVRTRKK